MGKEQPQINPFELLSKISPEKFSQSCDSLVDFQISQQLLIDIAQSVQSGRMIALVTTHQSYFEIETQRRFCQELNKISPDPITTYLTYSAPAVDLNIGDLFELRRPVYDQCHLNMLGIIRQEDRTHLKYKKNITPKMEEENFSNSKTLIRAMNQGGCVLIVPLEAKLNSGRINSETGKINGIQATDTDEGLTRMIRKNALIVPCGIDGSYKIIDPDNHQATPEFINAFSRPPQEKSVIFRANKLIDLSQEYQGKKIPENCYQKICHRIIIEVANNVSPDAQGAYRQFCSA